MIITKKLIKFVSNNYEFWKIYLLTKILYLLYLLSTHLLVLPLAPARILRIFGIFGLGTLNRFISILLSRHRVRMCYRCWWECRWSSRAGVTWEESPSWRAPTVSTTTWSWVCFSSLSSTCSSPRSAPPPPSPPPSRSRDQCCCC